MTAHTLLDMRRPRKPRELRMTYGATSDVAAGLPHDMVRAIARIGGPKPRARARWLIEDFLATPPSELAAGEVMNRQQELGGLVVMWLTQDQASPDESRMEFDVDLNTLRSAWRKTDDLVRQWASVGPDGLVLP